MKMFDVFTLSLQILTSLAVGILIACNEKNSTERSGSESMQSTKTISEVEKRSESDSDDKSKADDTDQSSPKPQNDTDPSNTSPGPLNQQDPVNTDPNVQPPNSAIQGRSCSDRQLRIVGGELVKANTLVALSTGGLLMQTSNGSGTCTGTLIGPRQMVTAAHCLQRDYTSIQAKFGLNNQMADLTIPIAKWVAHPFWTGQGFSYDIGLVVLKNDVPSQLLPVAIASSADLTVGTDIIIAGYGTPSQNAEQTLPLSMVSVPLESVSPRDRYFSTIINGKGGCFGDSGGPGYIVDKQTSCLKVAGVVSVSSVKGNGICGQGDTMMDVTRYQGWIDESLKQLGAPLAGLVKDGSETAATQNRLKGSN